MVIWHKAALYRIIWNSLEWSVEHLVWTRVLDSQGRMNYKQGVCFVSKNVLYAFGSMLHEAYFEKISERDGSLCLEALGMSWNSLPHPSPQKKFRHIPLNEFLASFVRAWHRDGNFTIVTFFFYSSPPASCNETLIFSCIIEQSKFHICWSPRFCIVG